MKRLLLERKPTGDTETEAFLSFPGTVLATIEQEWRPNPDFPGGEPFNSCVPAGLYKLVPFTRPNGQEVVALVNEDLGVFLHDSDRPAGKGRYLILIHIGNWAHDIVGCIAPGLGKADSDQGPMVTSSKAAMKRIMDYIDGEDAVIDIRWITES